MKISLIQINPIVGNLSHNKEKILKNYFISIKNNCDLVLFPEMAITGYPISDLIYEDKFIDENIKILEEIAIETTIPMIVGYISKVGEKLYNSLAICCEGEKIHRYDKILLPNYDVFDEKRYFFNGDDLGVWNMNYRGGEIKIGLQICEDLWGQSDKKNISEKQKLSGAELIINISASPYHRHRFNDRLKQVQKTVRNINIPFFYCNMVGAQDELIFDGQSFAVNHKGDLIGVAKAFEEDILDVDLNNNVIINKKRNELDNLYSALILGVKDYFFKTGHKEAVLGLSGGIDSSLVACIAADALGPENIHGISMPSIYSSESSKVDARELADNLNINYLSLSIEKIVSGFMESLTEVFKNTKKNVAEENIQARIRGSLLMALANKFNWLVLSTGNKTELALGYCTLYGDMNGGLSVISDLSKTKVYELSNWINNHKGCITIPKNSIKKPPSAELAPEQVDPFDYSIVSPIVDAIVEDGKTIKHILEEGYDSRLVKSIYNRIRNNEYKRRQAAPGLRVSKKAFGIGRRMPIVNQYYIKKDSFEL